MFIEMEHVALSLMSVLANAFLLFFGTVYVCLNPYVLNEPY